MDHINYAAIVTALAHVWEAAQRGDRFRSHAGVHDRIEALYQRCVQSLQTLLADVHAQGISTVLWSSAKLGFDPDAVVPGMTLDLSLRLLKLIEVSEEKQRPNAQACANLVWALATMGHPAATSEVVDPFCLRFASLTRHADTLQRPTAQAAANVLWALATLGHPTAAEVLDSVCLHFASLTQHADTKQRPTPQAAANVLWALATMGHSTAAEVLDCVCWHFASLTQHADTHQRPKAQESANVLWALASMGHQAAAEVLDSVTTHFAHLVGSPNVKQRPDAQAVANVLWALGTLKHTPRGVRLLDAFLAYFHVLLRSEDQRTRPGAQNIANTLWALKELKHAPSHDLVSTMLDAFIVLCQTPGLQPNSQEISNCLLACAALRLGVRLACVETFMDHILGMHVSRVVPQNYCNIAWSLAVMGCLTISIFDALLEQLSSKSVPSQLTIANRQQLHQALAWLKPASGSQQMEAWSSLRSRLSAIAAEPPLAKQKVRTGQSELWAALALQSVSYKVQVPCGMYRAAAVLSPRNSNVAVVLLMLAPPGDFLQNVPSRLLGHVDFRNKMLGRYGTVVTIPYNPNHSSVESMAGAIKAAVEAKTGLPLDSFRH
ncbi:hypothetical protein ABBQ38_013648 [Trebouxia sp. C0009 RCD-2024]